MSGGIGEEESVTGFEVLDHTIRQCFAFLSDSDRARFRRKFRQHQNNEEQTRHTLRELMLGGFLAKKGLTVEAERRIGRKTPDWCVLGEDNSVRAIIEMVNFHTDRDRETEIRANLQEGKVYCIWGNDVTIRMYQELEEKALAYKDESISMGVPYVVSLYGDFLARFDHDDIRSCLLDGEAPLFSRFTHVSGVIYSADGGGFRFYFLGNPNARHPIELPAGWF